MVGGKVTQNKLCSRKSGSNFNKWARYGISRSATIFLCSADRGIVHLGGEPQRRQRFLEVGRKWRKIENHQGFRVAA